MWRSEKELAAGLVHEGILKTPRLVEAFYAIDRADFVRPEFLADAYVNAPLLIGYGQTISQPLTVAFMLELLQPQPGERILDIGAGSGWQTALIAHIVGDSISKIKNKKSKIYGTRPSRVEIVSGVELQPLTIMPTVGFREGKVFAIERIPELCAFGTQNVAKYDFIEKGVVEFSCQDGSRGLPEHAPFDKIIAAAAARELPAAWREQLKTGGRIVTPIHNSVWSFEKVGEDNWRETEYPGFAFVPLIRG